ncbi:DnaJ domain protein [Gregarina niphandrodes]|uniref:DnaJ domain protein n=1 Tax=Gregarina niphandrodes TaxID=110365 RepID=A0A023B5W1_GRENI|nr:DnaJ domain protein [Gregarina niphandrodes]EZG63536.1 DnaJ domain protein [Gregarina niphandrodes]|eukprot:XP_011130674.1 DnaJ domain protein [Gregarina niphandrodes]
MFFGGGGRRRGPPRSDDVQSKIAFNLEDFFNGATKSMAINHDVICEECKGEGGPLDAIQKCEDCGGKGIQLLYERMGPMIRQSQAPCRACGTKGKRCAPGKQCKKCSGKGVVRERKVVEVHLPRGAPDGHRVTFTGDADQVPGQLPGDVIFNCVQRPHDVYTRRGDDLFMTKEITLKEALCGGGFYIRTLDQEEKFIQLNQTIKQDQVLAVENEGMSRNGSMFVRGNLFIRFDIKFPTLSDAEKKILEKALKGDLLKPRPDSEVLSLKYIDPKTQDRRGDDEDEYEQGPGNVQCKQA